MLLVSGSIEIRPAGLVPPVLRPAPGQALRHGAHLDAVNPRNGYDHGRFITHTPCAQHSPCNPIRSTSHGP